MNVTIIGTGNMAKGIATRLLAGGHTVELHARDISKGEALKAELASPDVSVHAIGSEVQDVIIPAVHYGVEFESIINTYESVLNGKVLVDITNPVDFSNFTLLTEPGKAGAEVIAALAPDAHVVKAFNTLFSAALVAGTVDGKPLDVFIAGDDQSAKAAVQELVNSSNMRAIDAGSLAGARHLEGIELIHLRAQSQIEGNFATAISFIK